MQTPLARKMAFGLSQLRQAFQTGLALSLCIVNAQARDPLMNPDDQIAGPSERSEWRWPREPEFLQQGYGRVLGLPAAVADNPELRLSVLNSPEDDAPRQAYADWMSRQGHEFARLLGAFITAQLRVAHTFRRYRRADVGPLRSWRGDSAYVSTPQFRAGDVLRPWFLDPLSSLISRGVVGWPQVYRGFVERVGVRARRFPEIADELFRIAPIRHLVVTGIPEAVEVLAACPHLTHIRSLSLPRYGQSDELSDGTLMRLVASPYLSNLLHLRLVHQVRVTRHAYEAIVTAATLPRLSCLEVFAAPIGPDHWQAASFDPRGRSERMIAYDTVHAAYRIQDGFEAVERAIGYAPCLHPEEHYGRESVDIEAIAANPIALDVRLMARRGLSVSGLPVTKASHR